MAQHWEYQYIPAGAATAPAIVERANEEGQRGWELVAVVPRPTEPGVDLIFKRPVSA